MKPDESRLRMLVSWAVSQITTTLTKAFDALSQKTLSVTVENQVDTTVLAKEIASNTRGLKGKLEELISHQGSVQQTIVLPPKLSFDSTDLKITEIKRIAEPVTIANPQKTVIVSNLNELRSVSVSNLKDIKIPEIKTEKVDFSTLEKGVGSLKTALNDILQVLPSIKSDPVSFPAFPEPKPFPKSISMVEGRDIEAEVKGLRADIEKLYELIDSKEFGGGVASEVRVSNFPPQSIPTPVTNFNLNSLRGIPKSTLVTVGTTETKLPATALAQRRSLIAFNNSGTTIYIGGSDVTVSTGFPVNDQNYSPPIDAGDQMFIYAISATPGAEVRVLEVSNDAEGN